ncbi:amino acid racemase [Trinickia sp.]|uniref:amino acid racemase n=1 Tax=Trinickia sp. TaxID=2571163 RepID=UPI003F7CFF1D
MHPVNRSLGVVGGLDVLGGADVFFKMIKSTSTTDDREHFDVVFEQHPMKSGIGDETKSTQRKLYIYDTIRAFEKRGVTTVVLPSFSSHLYLDELRENSAIEIVDMIEGLHAHVRRRFPRARRIGVLTTDFIAESGLFERYFAGPEFEMLYPHADSLGWPNAVTRAVYGPGGIQAGNGAGRPIALLREACADLIARGVDLLVTGLTELGLVVDQLDPIRVPLIDANEVYAHYVVHGEYASRAPAFKIGVVGGVGPAATVDFMQKIVRNTPAVRDQDHIKLLVEQNPQIPDRTENLVGNGADPTVSLYATCKKLEAGDADVIAIPCNTAHAFVEQIQPYLNVPIVNMLSVTADFLRATFPMLREVGVLATSGTIASGVYERSLTAAGLVQVTPPPALQERVMRAIYGPRGVKAGYTSGECMDDIVTACDALMERGCQVIILGCTELPLLLPQGERSSASGRTAWLVDPTELLAKRCVAYARGELDLPGTHHARATSESLSSV